MKISITKLLLTLATLFIVSPHQAFAQTPITVSHDQLISNFPNGLLFQITTNSYTEIKNITLLYRTNRFACQEQVARQEVEFTPDRTVTAEWDWNFSESEIVPLGAEIYWQWEIEDASGNKLVTEEKTYRVSDERHSWNTLQKGSITLAWYQGEADFNRSLLDSADISLTKLAKDAGISSYQPIWITIYPTVEEVWEADGRVDDWGVGVAHIKYNTIVMAADPSELESASTSLTHELSHLVIGWATSNCHGGEPPLWLDEGLATNAEGVLSQDCIDYVTSALRMNTLPPLVTLEHQFSSIESEADLAYDYSAMVVSYMLDKYGEPKLVTLLAEIQSGNSFDQAMQDIYGLDTNALDAEWRNSLGFSALPPKEDQYSSQSPIPTLVIWPIYVHSSESLTANSSPDNTNQPLTSILQNMSQEARIRIINLLGIICVAGGLLVLSGLMAFVIVQTKRKSL